MINRSMLEQAIINAQSKTNQLRDTRLALAEIGDLKNARINQAQQQMEELREFQRNIAQNVVPNIPVARPDPVASHATPALSFPLPKWKPIPVRGSQEAAPKPAAEQKPEPAPASPPADVKDSSDETKDNKKNKNLLYAGIALGVLVLGYFIFKGKKGGVAQAAALPKP
jgi:hypothetical protein